MSPTMKVTDDMVEHVGRNLYIYWDSVKHKTRLTYKDKVRRVLETMPELQPTIEREFPKECPHGEPLRYSLNCEACIRGDQPTEDLENL